MAIKTEPGDINTDLQSSSGQQVDYLVLSDEERAKGFVRPVRTTYRHTGMRPSCKTRELDKDELERYSGENWVLYEEYPKDPPDPTRPPSATGRYWTQAELDSGCGGTETKMALEIAETYARDPKFYGSTFCVECRGHFPVGEFEWSDGQKVGA